MMNPISVVILTHNEEHNIVSCIRSARLISEDIIVVDANSDDQTTELAQRERAKVFKLVWQGYGFARNFGAARAKYNWILALDADERISTDLALSISKLGLVDSNCIFSFRRENYLGKYKIRFGTLGFETVKRLYNRNHTQWDLTLVHEKLTSGRTFRKRIAGHIDHYGFKTENDYRTKAVLYAQMSAEKYFLHGKTAGFVKRYLSPAFNSAKSFVFQLGFLDGKIGWTSAGIIAYYSWLKYLYLYQMVEASKTRSISFASKQQIERA
jgi:glycosyltransferase involved in cell wall biosynthesis